MVNPDLEAPANSQRRCEYVEKKVGKPEERCTECTVLNNNMCLAHMLDTILLCKGHDPKKNTRKSTKNRPNAWLQFGREHRPAVQRENPKLPLQEINQILSKMWKEVDNKGTTEYLKRAIKFQEEELRKEKEKEQLAPHEQLLPAEVVLTPTAIQTLPPVPPVVAQSPHHNLAPPVQSVRKDKDTHESWHDQGRKKPKSSSRDLEML